MNQTQTNLASHLKHVNAKLYNEDLVALFLPLFKALTPIFDDNKVANIFKLSDVSVVDNAIVLDTDYIDCYVSEPSNALSAVEALMEQDNGVFDISERLAKEVNVSTGVTSKYTQQLLADDEMPLEHPVYVLGYRSYEQLLGHYDQKTELFICGLLMASFAFDVDFTDKAQVEAFIENRDSLYFLNTDLHPTLLMLIADLTELDRHKRVRDIRELVWKLENYKDYRSDHEVDIFASQGFTQQHIETRDQWVLNHLKGRLFDISRRNRLLYFKSSSKFLNLTVASVPTVLYHENIKTTDLFLWHDKIATQLKDDGKINLARYLQFDETGYIKAKLDKIRSEARKDQYEYGFSQLKLVIAYLNWYNVKEAGTQGKAEKISSPLLLVPVKLTKRKGVDDIYQLQFSDSDIQVNPVLAHYLKELYDIDLPESFNANDVSITTFYDNISKLIASKSQGIRLVMQDKPKLKLIQSIAKQHIRKYDKRTRYQTTEFNISGYDYSYKKDAYSPLGAKIFQDKIRPRASYLEYLINDDITPTVNSMMGNMVETATRSLYQIDKDGETNPYRWEFDVCNLTLGNFNYKKMSLVRDYNAILDASCNDPVSHSLSDNIAQDDTQPSAPTIDTAANGGNLFQSSNAQRDNIQEDNFQRESVQRDNFQRNSAKVKNAEGNDVDDNMHPSMNPVFHHLFSDAPKKLPNPDEALPSFEENFYLLNADATQARAISKAKTGDSIIIQGPPGTGKSQTITNLIADYTSRGKKVLFVCEKRAALDVVYSRLKQNDIHHLASLVHDSQNDKKDFIMDAKQTYEAFIKEKDNFPQLQKKRNALFKAFRTELAKVEHYHQVLRQVYPEVGMQLIGFIEQVLTLNQQTDPQTHQHSNQHSNQHSDNQHHTTAMDATHRAADAYTPNYATWQHAKSTLQRLSSELKTLAVQSNTVNSTHTHHPTQAHERLGAFSLTGLEDALLNADDPSHQVSQTLETLLAHCADWEQAATKHAMAEPLKCSLAHLQLLAQSADVVLQLQNVSQQNVFVADSVQSKALDEMQHALSTAKHAWEKASSQNTHWKEKLDPVETQTVLQKMRNLETKFWRFFVPSFYRFRGLIRRLYDFSQHNVKPQMTLLLENLSREHHTKDTYQDTLAKAQQTYGTDDFFATKDSVDALKNEHPVIAEQLHRLTSESLASMHALHDQLDANMASFQAIGADTETDSIASVQTKLHNIKHNLNTLPVLLPYLKAFAALNDRVKTFVRSNHNTLTENEHAIAQQSLQRLYDTDITIVNASGFALKYAVEKIQHIHQDILALNGDYLLAKFRSAFKAQLHNASLLAKEQDAIQKQQKKDFNKARKILENEFNKKIRYKSIRELKSSESAYILDMLKPIWLMSPLSVSDTLPVDADAFDVVIFDEASQITLEEGVPTLFRSRQAIIVGDEMQMPPTNFFSSNNSIAQAEEDEEDAASNREKIAIDADSMLTHASQKLEDVMLSWHYRSRYESLIAFSNAAFYEGELLTIPDRGFDVATHADVSQGVSVKESDADTNSHIENNRLDKNHAASKHSENKHLEEDATHDTTRQVIPKQIAAHEEKDKHHIALNQQPSAALALVQQSAISFHFQEDGLYEKRQNKVEAQYIAHLVNDLLITDPTQSIGIVAFSMQQQDNIEQALTQLASQDAQFAKLIHAAYEREEDEQHVGLFIKNLENVQGDERDVIIISVCYGYNAKGKMLMNFGPINRKGGEKRLNVIFSRAKKHMAIVSSIQYHDIKNEYNEGANYLRRFLQYAEHISAQNRDMASNVLATLTPRKDTSQLTLAHDDVVATQLCAYIASLGFDTVRNVGLSDFKIAIAVKPNPSNEDSESNNPVSQTYCLGILLDGQQQYQSDRTSDTLDQYVLRPNLLSVFGWQTLNVYKKDWLEKPDLVKTQVKQILLASDAQGGV